MSEKKMKKVVSIMGNCFEVDISDEVCLRVGGFRHGDSITHPKKIGRGAVKGVAPAEEGMDPEPLVLWCEFDEDNGKVGYSYPQTIVSA